MERSCCEGFGATFWSHPSAGAAADASGSAEQLKPVDIIQAGAGACGRGWR